MTQVNQKTGCYSWEAFKSILASARAEKARGNQPAVDQARRDIIMMGTRAQVENMPGWMR